MDVRRLPSRPRRGRYFDPPFAQQVPSNPPIALATIRPARTARALPVRRGHRFDPAWVGKVPNPPIVTAITRSRVRWAPARRGRRFDPCWPATSALTPPGVTYPTTATIQLYSSTAAPVVYQTTAGIVIYQSSASLGE